MRKHTKPKPVTTKAALKAMQTIHFWHIAGKPMPKNPRAYRYWDTFWALDLIKRFILQEKCKQLRNWR